METGSSLPSDNSPLLVPIQFTPSHYISVRSILILSFHVCLALPSITAEGIQVQIPQLTWTESLFDGRKTLPAFGNGSKYLHSDFCRILTMVCWY
jgi:hypothetical protein